MEELPIDKVWWNCKKPKKHQKSSSVSTNSNMNSLTTIGSYQYREIKYLTLGIPFLSDRVDINKYSTTLAGCPVKLMFFIH